MFSYESRCQYQNNQLADVICQLRFPDILTINAAEPAAFQELIREEYPQYAKNVEPGAPKIVGTPGNFHVETPPSVINYQFTSMDGIWQINLTSKFISITCRKYTNWETFARRLDKPLAAFIKVYKPACFQRIGLRYLNFISRQSLSLEDHAFSDLIDPIYLGPISSDDVNETSFNQNSVDSEFALRNGCRAKIHAGPGIVKKNGHTDKEVKFIFDQDLYVADKVPVNCAAEVLDALHTNAWSIFRGAITDTLHNSMEPTD